MPSMSFTRGGKYPYHEGKFYLGVTPLFRRPVGVKLIRHGLCVGSSRSGKGVAIIAQNLFRYPHNVLVIDPKGEAAKLTAAYRKKKFGQNVYVIGDHKGCSSLDTSLRASFNPLSEIDLNSGRVYEEINIIADGIVLRHDPRHGQWDNAAKSIIAGLIALVLIDEDIEEKDKTLLMVREILRDNSALEVAKSIMKNDSRCGGLMQSAVNDIEDKEQGNAYLQSARRNTNWLENETMKKALGSSSFSLSELKRGKASVYLVVPAKDLKEQGQFLRLFVRSALSQMERLMPDGSELGSHCLFILDEFYALGKIDAIATSIGLLPGSGVHLLPILQNSQQLSELYNEDGAEKFYASSDVEFYFDVMNQPTLEKISKTIGQRYHAGLFDVDKDFVGKPLMSPQEVKAHISMSEKNKVARRMIAFARGNDVLSVRLKPWFKDARYKKYG